MHPSLNRNLFVVKEHLGIFKAANNYDILDPVTKQTVLQCREERLGMLTRMFRFTDYKRMTPFHIEVRTPEGEKVLEVSRAMTLFLSEVSVHDEAGQKIGGFKQKLFSLGGKFEVVDAQGEVICHLKGRWTGWNFRFLDGDKELASVSKKWSGIGKELFTSADNYVLQIQDSVPPDSQARQLILAAVLCVDMVLKE